MTKCKRDADDRIPFSCIDKGNIYKTQFIIPSTYEIEKEWTTIDTIKELAFDNSGESFLFSAITIIDLVFGSNNRILDWMQYLVEMRIFSRRR